MTAQPSNLAELKALWNYLNRLAGAYTREMNRLYLLRCEETSDEHPYRRDRWTEQEELLELLLYWCTGLRNSLKPRSDRSSWYEPFEDNNAHNRGADQ